MTARREIALAAGAAVLFGAAIVAALDWQPPTAKFPIIISIAGVGLALWAIVADILKGRGDDTELVPLSGEDRQRARGAFIWIGVFFAAVLLIGFEFGVGLAAFAFYRLEARLGWAAAAFAGAVCGSFLYLAAHFLNIPLYTGFVVDLLS